MTVYENPISMIGKTPLIKHHDIYIKLESYNPTGSIKDRTAYFILKSALDNKIIKANDTLIEASSGNMGISLAFLCKFYNINCKIVMPDTMSVERINLMKLYGADVILSDGKKGMTGSIEKLKIMAKENNYIFLDQFSNENNCKAHYQTAIEILNDLPDVDIIICGIGTGGTITGIAKYLKSLNKDVKVIGVEPEESAIISKNKTGVHQIQGIGAGFVPKVFDKTLINEIYTVTSKDAIASTKQLINEQVMVGISSGAVYHVAQQVKKQNPDKKIVIIAPDGVNKYMSVLNV